jgi:negative regulator of sigma E activity
MNASGRHALILLTMFAPAVLAAPNATELAARMREARLTPGFEARVQATNVSSDGQRSEAVKLAVIGQFDSSRRRLLVRGIAPESIRNENRLAEYRTNCVRVLDRGGAIDPHAPLFGTTLVAWDMLTPWWEWPRQSLAGIDRVAGRACSLIRSRSADREAPIGEVLSCVDADAGLALRTQLFDGHGVLVRSIAVVSTLRKESGLLAAKKLTITAGNMTTEAETYSGDEHYEIPTDTFAPLDAQPTTCR